MNQCVFVLREAATAAVPLVVAGVGELVAETAGVINVGIEGLMLIGCIAAYTAAGASANGYVGVAAAIGAATLLALVFALATVWQSANQIVAGTALNLLAFGVAGTAWQAWQNVRQNANLPLSLPPHTGFNRLNVPWLNHVPWIGAIVFQQYGLFYVGFALAVGAWLALHKTRAGLIVRALGDAPAACEAVGVRVRLGRTLCVLFAGACAGLAGAYLSIMRTHAYAPEMTGGQGFVVLALVIFGRWSVPGLCGGCLFFGAIDALQQTLQAQRATMHSGALRLLEHIPFPFFEMLPYVTALAALTILTRASPGPRYLGRPWPERA